MSNMQKFHQALSNKTSPADQRRTRLAQLTRISRDQVIAVATDDWFIWSAGEAATSTAR